MRAAIRCPWEQRGKPCAVWPGFIIDLDAPNGVVLVLDDAWDIGDLMCKCLNVGAIEHVVVRLSRLIGLYPEAKISRLTWVNSGIPHRQFHDNVLTTPDMKTQCGLRSVALAVALATTVWSQSAAADVASEEIEEVLDRAEQSQGSTNRLIVPVPISNPQLGSGLVLAAAWIYQPKEGSNPWTSGIGGLSTSNGSLALAAFHNMSLAQDTIRINAALGVGDVNMKYFGTGEAAGDLGDYVELNQKAQFGQVKATTEIVRNVSIGAKIRYLDLKLQVHDIPAAPPDVDLDQLRASVTQVSFGPLFSYDSRDNTFFPRSGLLINGEWIQTEISGDYRFDYSKARFSANAYFDLSSDTVFAARSSLCVASDHAPFFDQCNYGSSSDLRGYVSGQYRDLASWALQGELRQHLFGNFGAAAFGGIGSIANDVGDFGSEKLLPAAGFGVRYAVADDYGINVRIDFAWGRNSNGIYLSVGEAF